MSKRIQTEHLFFPVYRDASHEKLLYFQLSDFSRDLLSAWLKSTNQSFVEFTYNSKSVKDSMPKEESTNGESGEPEQGDQKPAGKNKADQAGSAVISTAQNEYIPYAYALTNEELEKLAAQNPKNIVDARLLTTDVEKFAEIVRRSLNPNNLITSAPNNIRTSEDHFVEKRLLKVLDGFVATIRKKIQTLTTGQQVDSIDGPSSASPIGEGLYFDWAGELLDAFEALPTWEICARSLDSHHVDLFIVQAQFAESLVPRLVELALAMSYAYDEAGMRKVLSQDDLRAGRESQSERRQTIKSHERVNSDLARELIDTDEAFTSFQDISVAIPTELELVCDEITSAGGLALLTGEAIRDLIQNSFLLDRGEQPQVPTEYSVHVHGFPIHKLFSLLTQTELLYELRIQKHTDSRLGQMWQITGLMLANNRTMTVTFKLPHLVRADGQVQRIMPLPQPQGQKEDLPIFYDPSRQTVYLPHDSSFMFSVS